MRTKSITELREYIVDEQRIKQVKKLWESALPIASTPAEKYLVETRGIPTTVARSLEFRSWSGPLGIAELDDNKPYKDYVVVPVRNLDDNLMGLQFIQISEDGQKAEGKSSDFYCKKYIGACNPPRVGRAALINQGKCQDLVFIAEGAETAASLGAIDEIRTQYSILAALGVDALPKVLGYVKTHYPPGATVVLLKDHDKPGSQADQTFTSAKMLFTEAGYSVVVKEPPVEDSDWNDVLKTDGIEGLHKHFSDLLVLSQPQIGKLDVDEEKTSGNQQIIPKIPSSVVTHFSKIHQELLKFEFFSERKSLLLKIKQSLPELEKKLSQLEKKLASQQFNVTVKELKDIQSALAVIREVEVYFTGPILKISTVSLDAFTKSREIYEEIKSTRDKVLNEDIDTDSESLDVDDGAIYRAYYSTLEELNKHLKSLEKTDLEAFKMNMILKNRLEKIALEISNVTKYIQEAKKDAEMLSVHSDRLSSLQDEQKFIHKELLRSENQPRLLKHHTGFSGHYARYSRHFVDVINAELERCQFQPAELRKILTKEKEKARTAWQVKFGKSLEQAYGQCQKYLGTEIEMVRKSIVVLEKQAEEQMKLLQESLPDSSERFLSYQQALSDLSSSPSNLRLLQEWLNSLSHFKMAGPLMYVYPSTQANSTYVDKFLDYDSDEEETLDTLTAALLNEAGSQSKGVSSSYSVEHKGDSESCSKEQMQAIADLCGIHIDQFTVHLYHSVLDFAEKLSLSLYKSFIISDPTTKAEQEFDGIALRGKCLTIIERKSNDGTGEGFLQRNFCQSKIVAKMQFLQKDVIARVISHKSPEDYLMLRLPVVQDWYSKDFTAEVRQRLISAAKAKIIEAFKAVSLEFTLNRSSKGFIKENYRGLFFNKLPPLCEVSVRFSTKQKGNEDVAHGNIDDIAEKRSGQRSG